MKWGLIVLCLLVTFFVLVSSSQYSTTRGELPFKGTRNELVPRATTTDEAVDTTTLEATTTEEATGENEGEDDGEEDGEEDGGEHEKEGHETGPMALNERNSILVIVTILIVLSIVFEFLRHVIEHAADEDMKPIVEGLFKELTVLGFVALVMFLVTQGDGLKHLSKHIFGEDEEMPELIELIHFMLFGMMIFFIIEVMILVRLAIRSEHIWSAREQKVRSQAALDECYTVLKNGKPPSKIKKYLHLLSASEKKYVEANSTIQYSNMREVFIREFNHQKSDILNPNSFDFNEYLTMCLAKQLEEIVEIHPVTWFIVDLFVLIMWGVLAAQRIVWIVLTTIFPYLVLAVTVIITRKLHWIRKQLVIQPSREINLDKSVVSVPKYKHRQLSNDSDADGTNYTHRQIRPRSALGKRIMGAPGNLHQQLFWFDKHGPHLLSQFLRVLLLMTAIYVCVFAAFVSRVTLWKYNAGPVVAVLIIGYIPVFFLICYVFPRYINRLSINVSIEMMKNSDVVSDVLQKSSIKKLVKMVKFIASLKSTLKNIKLAQETVRITRGDLEGGASQFESIPEEYREEMRQAFDLFDRDHSGHVSREEFHQLMELMGYKSTPAELDNIMKIIDVNGDGQISLQEFTVFSYEVNRMSASSSKEESIGEFIDTAFSIFDADGSGHVTKVEFMHVLNRIYPEITMEAANDIADEIDHDKSGVIEKYDFAKIIKRHMKELKKETGKPKKAKKSF